MLGWEVIKGKEHFFIFFQALAGFWEFNLVTGDELVVGCQSGFAGRSQVHFMDQKNIRPCSWSQSGTAKKEGSPKEEWGRYWG
jgi:hypothetical protein